MSVIDDVMQVLHRIRVKLYPGNLPEADGTSSRYETAVIARSQFADDEAIQTRNRGVGKAGQSSARHHLKRYPRHTVAYQLVLLIRRILIYLQNGTRFNHST